MYSKPLTSLVGKYSSDELAAESIFCNNKTQTGNRSIYPKNWIDNGVFYIKNILKENGAFKTFNQFKEKIKLIQITLHILAVYKRSKATFLKQD